MPTQTFSPTPTQGPTGAMGLPPMGYVPTDVLNALYNYYSFGPTQSQQLANLQFSSNIDAQNANNKMAMDLATGAASNRLADNMASKLAIQGMGPVPGFGSAFQGGFGVHPVNPGNIFQMYGESQRPLNAVDALMAQKAGNTNAARYIENVSAGNQPQPQVPGAYRYYPGNQGPQGTPNPFGIPQYATGGTIPTGSMGIVGDQGPELAFSGKAGTEVLPQGVTPDYRKPFGGTTPPNATTDYRQPMGFGGYATPQNGQNFTAVDALRALRGGNPNLANSIERSVVGLGAPPISPFADVSRLAGFGGAGRPAFGVGPRSFSDPMLGISNVMAPWTNASQYYGLSPDQQQAQDYMLSLFGYTPQMAQYQRQAATPGARNFQQRAFGY